MESKKKKTKEKIKVLFESTTEEVEKLPLASLLILVSEVGQKQNLV